MVMGSTQLRALALIGTIAACIGLVTSDVGSVKVTQAGCACLDNWQDSQGNTQVGCVNPNGDPKGAWCAVDGGSCPGYYAYTEGFQSKRLFYDYCGEVRERTQGGCLCNPTWELDGIGKEYEDRCANPASPTLRVCTVNLATCKNTTNTNFVDACEAKVEVQEDKTTTYNNCTCTGWPGWSYVYQTGLNVTYMSCANPDGDPLGSWCAIDPTKCDRFAGQLNVPGGVVVNYDYCNSAPLSARRDPSVCTDRVSEYEQCGGKSHCTAYGCADEVWPGVCCPSGLTCHRQNAYYYQCLTDEDAAAARAAAAAAAAAAGGSASPAGPLPGQASPSPQVVTPVASPDPASPPAVRVKVPGFEVKNTLRLNYDFNKLLVPGAMTAFKADLVSWLSSVAGIPDYIYAINVASVTEGSVVAETYIIYTADAPVDAVDASVTRLRESGASAYESRGLPDAWGAIMSYRLTVGPSGTTLLDSTVTTSDGVIPPPATLPGRASKTINQPGIIAAISIGCAAVVGIAGFVVSRGLGDQAAKRKDESKSKQLAYIYEMQEMDIAAEMVAEGKLGDGELQPYVEASGNSRLWAWLGGIPPPDAKQLAAANLSKTNFGLHGGLPISRPPPSDISNAAPPSHSDANVSSMGVAGTPKSSIIASAAEPAFLPMPEGEGAVRSSSGIAYAHLKQRRISNSQGGASTSGGGGASSAGGATNNSIAAASTIRGFSAGGGVSSMGGMPTARDAEGVFSPLSGQISRFGSTVANYISGGGAAPAAEEKEH